MPRESIRSMNHKFIGTLNLVFDILLYFEFDYLVSPVYFRQARLVYHISSENIFIMVSLGFLAVLILKKSDINHFKTFFINDFMHSMSHRL